HAHGVVFPGDPDVSDSGIGVNCVDHIRQPFVRKRRYQVDAGALQCADDHLGGIDGRQRACSVAATISPRRTSGVSNGETILTPSGLSASSTALAMAAGGPMVPLSPTPLKPPGTMG